jgi:hypothetical protein
MTDLLTPEWTHLGGRIELRSDTVNLLITEDDDGVITIEADAREDDVELVIESEQHGVTFTARIRPVRAMAATA